MLPWAFLWLANTVVFVGAKPTKVIAGVPVYLPDHHKILDNINASLTKSWNVVLKPFGDDISILMDVLCDQSSPTAPCQRHGHPERGGIGFVTVVASDAELEAYATAHPESIEFIEYDMPIYIPHGDLGNSNDTRTSLLEEETASLESKSSNVPFFIICSTAPKKVHGYITPLRFSHARKQMRKCTSQSMSAMITRADEFKLIKWHGPSGIMKDITVAEMRLWWDKARKGQLLSPSGWPIGHWGIDRIDARIGRDESYSSNGLDGSGVHVYVLDTGIRTTHKDFGGRAIPTLESFENIFHVCDKTDEKCASDSNGHGTHCAGTVGGATMGVAKGATLHAVKVLNNGGAGSVAGVVAAIDWIMQNAMKPTVVTMSLTSLGKSEVYKAIVDKATAAGIVIVTAAGNEYDDACGYSPAYVPSAITVGATTISDTKAGFSNYGSCIDIFAPGLDILSAWSFSDSMYLNMSGTSMACPHVAGAAALHLQRNNSLQPSEVSLLIKGNATKDVLSDLSEGSPNLLLFVEPAPTSGEPSSSTTTTLVATTSLSATTMVTTVRIPDRTTTLVATTSLSATTMVTTVRIPDRTSPDRTMTTTVATTTMVVTSTTSSFRRRRRRRAPCPGWPSTGTGIACEPPPLEQRRRRQGRRRRRAPRRRKPTLPPNSNLPPEPRRRSARRRRVSKQRRRRRRR
jgi:subtilisin family serine protease